MEEISIPKATEADHVHTAVLTILSAIPWVGGSAATLFNAIVSPPLTERKDKWIQSIADELVKLIEANKNISPESLSNDEAFITAAMQATQIALRNHQKEKLEALKNAVLHVANRATDDDLHLIYINLIDTLTPWHIRLLRLLHSPMEIARQNGYSSGGSSMGSIGQVIMGAYAELNDLAFCDQLILDLFNRGLSSVDQRGINTTMTMDGAFEKRTTPIGDSFLEFIS